VRAIIHAADPQIIEEWKWMGTPVWSHGGIVCTGEDPSGLFNSSLERKGKPKPRKTGGKRSRPPSLPGLRSARSLSSLFAAPAVDRSHHFQNP
jgi:hypothetical protein